MKKSSHNKKTASLTFALMFLTFCVALGNDLYLSGKGMDIYADSDTGRFYLEDPSPNDAGLKYLLFKDNPATSYITLILNDNPYYLNDSALAIEEGLHEDGDQIIGEFSLDDNINIWIKYILTNAISSDNEGGQNDTLLIVITVENNSEEEITAGSRFLFDTYYEERWGDPFIYQSSTELIEYERLLREESIPSFFFNGIYDIDDGFTDGLFIYPYINEIMPDYAIIGNWKMLEENELDYEVEPRAEFKYNDYSNKDAAIAVFFESINIKPGERINFGTVLSREEFEFTQYIGNRHIVNVVEAIEEIEIETNELAVLVEPTNEIVPTAITNITPIETVETNIEETPALIIDTNGMSESEMNQVNQLLLLQTQLEVLERLTDLIEKMDSAVSAEPIATTSTPAEVIVTNAPIEEEVIQEGFSPEDVEAIKTEYEEQIVSLQEEYENQLDKQQDEFNVEMASLEKEILTSLSYVKWSNALQDIDETIKILDEKISVIEQLVNLNLDFESMPESELEKLNETIDDLENTIYNINVD